MMTPNEMRKTAFNSAATQDVESTWIAAAEICERLDKVVELLEGMSPPLRINFDELRKSAEKRDEAFETFE